MEMFKYLGRSFVMAKVIPCSHCDQYLTIRSYQHHCQQPSACYLLWHPSE